MTQAPPPPTATDTRRVKAMTQAVAKAVRQQGRPVLEAADTAWM